MLTRRQMGRLLSGAARGAALFVLGATAVGTLAADASNTRVVLGAEVALGGFATTPANLGIKG
jgi:hypothetical protein